jgi:hypothetical protein
LSWAKKTQLAPALVGLFLCFKAANNTHHVIQKYSIKMSNSLAVLVNFRGRESHEIFLNLLFCKPMIYSL